MCDEGRRLAGGPLVSRYPGGMPVSHERSAWTDERLDDLVRYTRDGFRTMDQRFTQIDQRFVQIDERFIQIDRRFVQMDDRFTQLEARFGQMDGRFDGLEGRLAALQRTLVIGMFGLSGTLLATMLAIVLRLG